MKESDLKYRRVLLKLGGESLAGDRSFGIDPDAVTALATRIVAAHELGIELAIVVGGGNFWRGGENSDINRATADYIGMLGTVMNALALQEAIERLGIPSRVQTAIEMREVAEPYIRRKAMAHLGDGRIVIFAAGSGNPYFTTDTAGALRAMEIGADALLKATKVDGAYTDDPMTNPNATRIDRITYLDALNNGLKILDATAFSLCMDNDLPIIVFRLEDPGSLVRILKGERVGTLVAA
jgi:uridylate kinase